LFDGALPTLIEWLGAHPAETLPQCGVKLQELVVGGLPESLAALLPPTVTVDRGRSAAPIKLTLAAPRGQVTLTSLCLES
jgi:hypothetical protein